MRGSHRDYMGIIHELHRFKYGYIAPTMKNQEENQKAAIAIRGLQGVGFPKVPFFWGGGWGGVPIIGTIRLWGPPTHPNHHVKIPSCATYVDAGARV